MIHFKFHIPVNILNIFQFNRLRIFLWLNLIVLVSQGQVHIFRDGKSAIFATDQEISSVFLRKMTQADSLFKSKNYRGAANTYVNALKVHSFEASFFVTRHYHAARALVLVGAIDSAFAILEPLVKKGGYYDYEEISTDTSLGRIHSDSRWQPLLKIVKIDYENRKKKYAYFITKADSLFRIKKFATAAKAYVIAFRADPKISIMYGATAKYNAACAWSLAGYPDSAFALLLPLINHGFYSNSQKISSDSALKSLHSDPRWQPLIDKAVFFENLEQSGQDRHLVLELNSMLHQDQVYRLMLDSVEKKFGKDSKEVKVLWKKMASNDSINQIRLAIFFAEYGWPAQKVIGMDGGLAIFLVLQHADLSFQLKYLPLAREALKKGNAQPEYLAYLEDRVALSQNKKQTYGTQLSRDPKTGKYSLDPIEDEINLNKRRKEVGLGPIEEYVKQFGIKYTPPK